ncbi:MAG: lamin tail domain-containing protein [Candidatus Methylacidiphilales bacterium]
MKKYTILLGSILLLTFFNSCKTEDIEPEKPIIVIIPDAVSLSSNKTNFLEDNDSLDITLKLDIVSLNNIEVKISYSGSATIKKDYDSIPDRIIILAGTQTATIKVKTIQDTIKESNETVIISIDSVYGGTVKGTKTLTLNIQDDDVPLPSPVDLIFNEILYDPATPLADGDANGDGVRDANGDEFIELYNNSTKPIDLSGFKIYDSIAFVSNSPRHIIPNGTILQPQKVIVIFGGGTPTGTFGNAIVQKASGGQLNITNGGDFINITDSFNIVLLSINIEPWSNDPNESYTRNPDVSGNFVQHTKVNTSKFSPGTKVDGSPF